MSQQSEPADAALLDLAAAYHVATEFCDWQGRQRAVPAKTVRAVLAALGIAAATAGEIEASLAEHRLARWRQVLPSTLVARQGWTSWFAVHAPHGSQPEVWIELEDGSRRHDLSQQDHWVPPRWVDGAQVGEATYQLPGDLPLGYHRLRARVPGVPQVARCQLIITPHRHRPPATPQRSWGWTLQLYSLRSRRSWGIGDLGDLADLAVWSGHEYGADFCLINPLNAAETAGAMEPSPYLPSSRRFDNPIYLRVDAITEYTELDRAHRKLIGKLSERAERFNRDSTTIDRDACWQLKRAALRLVHQVPRSIGRQAEYAAFRDREGAGLEAFARYSALADSYGPHWPDWPAELQDPGSAAVADFAGGHQSEVDFHRWLQWQLDCQQASAHARAEAAAMTYGIIGDLAVGVHPYGADTWALGSVFASSVEVGVPPDEFNQLGQNWTQPPLRPDRLAETGYQAWRDLVRSLLRHSGGLRIDHIAGLFRLWWIPAGAKPTEGTYVRYDHEALVGILLLEATRVRGDVVLIGEDLGTVEPWVRSYLAERGLLGTSVLWFERTADDEPLPPERWRTACLATVTTHDLPPTTGYLAGDHIRLRDRLGLLERDLAAEIAADEHDRQTVIDALLARHLLPPGTESVRRIVEALYAYVAQSPARLIGVALTDAVGERRIQNQPGTDDEYPNWRVPLSDQDGNVVLLEDLPGYRRLRRLLGAIQL